MKVRVLFSTVVSDLNRFRIAEANDRSNHNYTEARKAPRQEVIDFLRKYGEWSVENLERAEKEKADASRGLLNQAAAPPRIRFGDDVTPEMKRAADARDASNLGRIARAFRALLGRS
jgi:hypothetical protein